MKTVLRGMILVSVLLMLSAPLFAGGAQEADYLAELQDALESEGLSEEEAQAVADAASSYDWSGMNRVDPEVIAEAIAEAIARVDDEATDLSADEAAQLAFELSEGAAEQLQSQIRTWKDGDQEEPLGETVRNTVSERARETARERETESRDEESGNGAPQDTPAADNAPSETGKGASGAGDR